MNRQPRQRDLLAGDMANRLDQEQGANRKTEPSVNPFGSVWQSLLDISSQGPVLRWGRVVDYVPMMNSYRLLSESGGVYTATFGSQTGHQPTGVHQGTMLPVGCGVLFFTHPQTYYGTIICVDPDFFTDPRHLRPDYISQGGRSGLYVEKAHDALLSRLQAQGGHACFNANRPLDAIAGDWNHASETGLMQHMDSFMAFFRVDEETGLYLFYHDQLARLAGHNLQIRTVLSEREELDDQLESIMISGSNPYYWERLGAFTYGQTIHTENTAADTLKRIQEYSVLEPLFDDQQPFDRVLDFGGYLGQGFKKMIVAPPQSVSNINRYVAANKYIGLLNIQGALDGSLNVESAKRIGLWKRSCIPVPKLMIRPEDQRGDNETNYKAAGLFGSGAAHVITADFTVGIVQNKEQVRASSILDLGAFSFNWQGLHPFHYHSKDWYVPDEGDGFPLFTNSIPPQFCTLQSQQYLSAPTPIPVKIDHRYNNSKVYPAESCIVMLEDGGIVIGDGFGSEIRMTGGSISITAPGDINLLPGKNVNCWAGWDFIARANNSADITANWGDVRLKAESNIQILGGNNGQGGVLIESRAKCANYDFKHPGEEAKMSGIIFVSKKAPVIVNSNGLFIEGVDTEANPATLSFNATDIVFKCERQHSILGEARFDFFPNSTNEYWEDQTLLGGSLRVADNIVGANGLAINGWITVAGGHISTELAPAFNDLVTEMDQDGIDDIAEELTYIASRETYLDDYGVYVDFSSNDSNMSLGVNVFDPNVAVAEFSMRTMNNYRTSGFVLYEARWQQLARLGKGIPAKWTENPVMFDSVLYDEPLATYAHPGKEPWLNANWYEQDLTLYNIAQGGSIDRTTNQAAYEVPTYGVERAKVFNGNYPIIRQCKNRRCP